MDTDIKPAPVFLAVYIGTTNDTNGNPRRGWYVSRLDGAPVATIPTDRKGEAVPVYTAWVEEGYRGRDSLYSIIAGAPQHGEVYGPESGGCAGCTNRAYDDRARSLLYETGRIEVTSGEYRNARKLPRLQ